MKYARASAGALLALLLAGATSASAQTNPCPAVGSTPQFTAGGNVFGRIAAQWNAYFGNKVDINHGTLCYPTIYPPIPGTALADPTAVIGITAVPGTATTALRSDGAPRALPASVSDYGLMKPDGVTETALDGVVSTASTLINGETCTPGGICNIPIPITEFGDPTATIGVAAVNGSATTAMRSDAAPAIPKGSTTTYGAVKADGTTITVADGVLSATGATSCGDLSDGGTACTADTGTTGHTVPFLDGVNHYGAAQIGDPITVTPSGAIYTPNFDARNHFVITLSSSCPCTLANPSSTLHPGQSGIIEIHQDATGGRTIGTLGTSYQYPGGLSELVLDPNANAVSELSYYVNSDNIIVFGVVVTGLAPAPVALEVGSSTIASGTDKGLLYDNAGVLGNLATANSGVLVTNGSGVPSISTTLPSGLAMQTPASINLSNGTALPVEAITGLGSGIATWLATPSSANLRTAMTDGTGSLLLYFQGGDLGTPSAGVATNLTGLPLTTGVTGTLAFGNGGTGQTSYTDGQLLIGNTATGGISKATLTQGANVTITNGNGTITIAASGGGGGCTTSGSANQILVDNGSGGCSSSTATVAAGVVTGSQLVSTVSTGTAPLTVTSTTNVANLNASSLGGKVTGTSGNTIPLLDGNNTTSGNNTHSGTETFSSTVVGGGRIVSGTTDTFAASDCGKTIHFTSASTITVTLPNNITTLECTVTVIQEGAGQITFSAAAGATLHNRSSFTKTAGQWGVVDIILNTNSGGTSAVYTLAGDGA